LTSVAAGADAVKCEAWVFNSRRDQRAIPLALPA